MAIKLDQAYNFAKYQPCLSIQLTDGDSDVNKEIAFTIKIQNKCLKSWYDLPKKIPEVKLINIINHFLAQLHIALLKEKCTRIEEHGKIIVFHIAYSKLSARRGRQYTVLSNLFRRINVLKSEVIPNQDLTETSKSIAQLYAQKIQLSEQNKSITERCEQLSENLNTLNDQKFRSEEMLEEQVN
jgi:hypothetical protein